MHDLFDRELMQPLWAQLPDRMHPTLVEMAEQMYLHLTEDKKAVELLGLDHLARIVVGQLDQVATKCGGTGFYLPRGVARRLSERDKEIYARFNGRNGHELAREYNLTDTRIDQIVAAARQADIERRQGKIAFDE